MATDGMNKRGPLVALQGAAGLNLPGAMIFIAAVSVAGAGWPHFLVSLVKAVLHV